MFILGLIYWNSSDTINRWFTVRLCDTESKCATKPWGEHNTLRFRLLMKCLLHSHWFTHWFSLQICQHRLCSPLKTFYILWLRSNVKTLSKNSRTIMPGWNTKSTAIWIKRILFRIIYTFKWTEMNPHLRRFRQTVTAACQYTGIPPDNLRQMTVKILTIHPSAVLTE